MNPTAVSAPPNDHGSPAAGSAPISPDWSAGEEESKASVAQSGRLLAVGAAAC
jgi:hypothetical protein